MRSVGRSEVFVKIWERAMDKWMRRKEIQIISVDQKNDATCIPNKRGMSRRAKRHSAKCVRQAMRRDGIMEESAVPK